MNSESDAIKAFLEKSPSLSEILHFIEEQAQRRVAIERKKAEEGIIHQS